MKYSIVRTLVERDGISEQEAEQMVREARERVLEDGEDPEEVLLEEFGLEPDYLEDLLG